MKRKKQTLPENSKLKSSRSKDEIEPKGWHLFSHLGDETVDTITGIIFLVLTIFNSIIGAVIGVNAVQNRTQSTSAQAQ